MYEGYGMRKMNVIVETGISGNLTDGNRLTPYFNRLHACYFRKKTRNFNYDNRIIQGINRLHVANKRKIEKAVCK